MLHIKKPNADGRSEQQDRQLDCQEWFKANQPDHCRRKKDNAYICRKRADPCTPARSHLLKGDTVLQQKQVGGSDTEHNDWISIGAVGNATERRARQILIYGQSQNVAYPPTVKVSGRRMMKCVVAL